MLSTKVSLHFLHPCYDNLFLSYINIFTCMVEDAHTDHAARETEGCVHTRRSHTSSQAKITYPGEGKLSTFHFILFHFQLNNYWLLKLLTSPYLLTPYWIPVTHVPFSPISQMEWQHPRAEYFAKGRIFCQQILCQTKNLSEPNVPHLMMDIRSSIWAFDHNFGMGGLIGKFWAYN